MFSLERTLPPILTSIFEVKMVKNGWWKLLPPQNLSRPLKQKQGAQQTTTPPSAPYPPTPASEEELKESPEETKRSFRVALRVCWPFPILDSNNSEKSWRCTFVKRSTAKANMENNSLDLFLRIEPNLSVTLSITFFADSWHLSYSTMSWKLAKAKALW